MLSTTWLALSGNPSYTSPERSRFLGTQVDSAIRAAPLNHEGHSWLDYKESRSVPSEGEAQMDPGKQAAREEAVAEGRTLPEVFQKAFDAAMCVFEMSKGFPKEETYSLTDQIRRSSRSVCANLAEAWRKRRYKASFIAKLIDAESEAAHGRSGALPVCGGEQDRCEQAVARTRSRRCGGRDCFRHRRCRVSV